MLDLLPASRRISPYLACISQARAVLDLLLPQLLERGIVHSSDEVRSGEMEGR